MTVPQPTSAVTGLCALTSLMATGAPADQVGRGDCVRRRSTSVSHSRVLMEASVLTHSMALSANARLTLVAPPVQKTLTSV